MLRKFLTIMLVLGACGIAQAQKSTPAKIMVPAPGGKTKNARIELGKAVFAQNCQACHQAEGQGIKGAFPPLAKSDYLNADVNRAIGVVANGLQGPIKVNGETYNGAMPKPNLTDEDIANVMTYVYNKWGNKGGEITLEQVKKAKAKR